MGEVSDIGPSGDAPSATQTQKESQESTVSVTKMYEWVLPTLLHNSVMMARYQGQCQIKGMLTGLKLETLISLWFGLKSCKTKIVSYQLYIVKVTNPLTSVLKLRLVNFRYDWLKLNILMELLTNKLDTKILIWYWLEQLCTIILYHVCIIFLFSCILIRVLVDISFIVKISFLSPKDVLTARKCSRSCLTSAPIDGFTAQRRLIAVPPAVKSLTHPKPLRWGKQPSWLFVYLFVFWSNLHLSRYFPVP